MQILHFEYSDVEWILDDEEPIQKFESLRLRKRPEENELMVSITNSNIIEHRWDIEWVIIANKYFSINNFRQINQIMINYIFFDWILFKNSPGKKSLIILEVIFNFILLKKRWFKIIINDIVIINFLLRLNFEVMVCFLKYFKERIYTQNEPNKHQILLLGVQNKVIRPTLIKQLSLLLEKSIHHWRKFRIQLRTKWQYLLMPL